MTSPTVRISSLCTKRSFVRFKFPGNKHRVHNVMTFVATVVVARYLLVNSVTLSLCVPWHLPQMVQYDGHEELI